MKSAKIVVLAGQSNAVGVGHVEYLTKHFSEEKVCEFVNGYEDIPIYYYSHDKRSNGFVKTSTGCTELEKNTVGPEVGIAEVLRKEQHAENYFIVKCAFGGTNIYHDWLSPSSDGGYKKEAHSGSDTSDKNYRSAGWCYNELVSILQESISTLKKLGYSPKIRAFCWMQGESDALESEHAKKYGERYTNLLKDFNSAFSGYLDGCAYIDAGISEVWKYYAEINRWKEKHALSAENSFYIDTIAHGLITSNEPQPEADIAHYDSDCIIKLGNLFANRIIANSSNT